jgi:hypothetical protein
MLITETVRAATPMDVQKAVQSMMNEVSSTLTAAEAAVMISGYSVYAMKMVRDRTSCDLRVARDIVHAAARKVGLRED